MGGGRLQVVGAGAGPDLALGDGRTHVHFRRAVSVAQSSFVFARPVSLFILWIAQGFGIGRIPFAPGTFGSLLGLVWFAVLLLPGNLWFGLGGMLAALFLSIWLCGAAEKILGRTDPGSVVLDEIVAVPLCFAVCVGHYSWRHGVLPAAGYFFGRDGCPLMA